jgi:hypothetical protein
VLYVQKLVVVSHSAVLVLLVLANSLAVLASTTAVLVLASEMSCTGVRNCNNDANVRNDAASMLAGSASLVRERRAGPVGAEVECVQYGAGCIQYALLISIAADVHLQLQQANI